jgi:hypothetical protein
MTRQEIRKDVNGNVIASGRSVLHSGNSENSSNYKTVQFNPYFEEEVKKEEGQKLSKMFLSVKEAKLKKYKLC